MFQFVRSDRFSQGQWNMLVYELSAAVIHLATRHAFVADISVWYLRGKKLASGGKNRCQPLTPGIYSVFSFIFTDNSFLFFRSAEGPGKRTLDGQRGEH